MKMACAEVFEAKLEFSIGVGWRRGVKQSFHRRGVDIIWAKYQMSEPPTSLDHPREQDNLCCCFCFFSADPLVGSIASQYVTNREEHDRIARDWTKRFAT